MLVRVRGGRARALPARGCQRDQTFDAPSLVILRGVISCNFPELFSADDPCLAFPELFSV